jgi:hypothetical protein
MMELVLGSFVVALPPLILSVGARTVELVAEVFERYGAHHVALERRAEPTLSGVARRICRPENCGHGF